MTNVAFSFGRYSDGVLVINLVPDTNIINWSIEATLSKRFGSDTPIYQASVSSGHDFYSGITRINDEFGKFSVTIPSIAISGLDPGNYAFNVERTDSGSRQLLVNGYMTLLPGGIVGDVQ